MGRHKSKVFMGVALAGLLLAAPAARGLAGAFGRSLFKFLTGGSW
jgi:hypothetical protein